MEFYRNQSLTYYLPAGSVEHFDGLWMSTALIPSLLEMVDMEDKPLWIFRRCL